MSERHLKTDMPGIQIEAKSRSSVVLARDTNAFGVTRNLRFLMQLQLRMKKLCGN